MGARMVWMVEVFETKRGEKPVEEFIQNLDESTVAKFIHTVDLLEKYGPSLGMPHAKKLTAGLYELWIRGKQEVRIIYGFIKKVVILLHAFKKQTQKTPKKEIETALSRLKIAS